MNSDIFYLICEHIEPNPVIYCKLALVSRHLYQVFAADAKWQPLNVLAVESNIIGSYGKQLKAMRTEQNSKWLMEHCWDKSNFIEHQFTYTGTNPFALLGAHVNSCTTADIPIPENVPKFIQVLLNLRPFALQRLDRPTEDQILAAVSKCGCVLQFVESLRMRNTKKIALKAIAVGCNHYCECDCLAEDCGCCSGNRDSTPLKHMVPRLQCDSDIITLALSKSWRALEFATPELQTTVIHHAVDQCVLALEFCKVKPRTLVLRAVSNCGAALEFCNNEHQDDREIFLAAIAAPPQQLHSNQHSWKKTLKHASSKLKNDLEIVRLALNADGNELAHVPVPLKRDPSIVLCAVQNRGSAISYASRIPPLTPEIILEASKTYAYALCVASSRLKSNVQFLLEIARQGGADFIMDADLPDDYPYELAELCVSRSPATFDCFPEYKLSRQFVLDLLEKTQNPKVFSYCGIAREHDFLLAAIRVCPEVVLELPWKHQTRALVCEALERDGSIFSSIKLCIDYRRDVQLVEIASSTFKSAWCYSWCEPETGKEVQEIVSTPYLHAETCIALGLLAAFIWYERSRPQAQ